MEICKHELLLVQKYLMIEKLVWIQVKNTFICAIEAEVRQKEKKKKKLHRLEIQILICYIMMITYKILQKQNLKKLQKNGGKMSQNTHYCDLLHLLHFL